MDEWMFPPGYALSSAAGWTWQPVEMYHAAMHQTCAKLTALQADLATRY
jgi:hypothetical protein